MSKKDVWKHIKGFEDHYLISSRGRIKSLKGNKVRALKSTKNPKGYLQIGLYLEGKHFNKTIHQLVAINFIRNPNNYPTVNHKDGDKLNNSVDNLEWCSISYNVKHSFLTGLQCSKGTNNPYHKLSDKEISAIREDFKIIKVTKKEICEEYGIDRHTLRRALVKGTSSRISNKDISKIKSRLKYHRKVLEVLSDKYKIHRSTIHRIVTNRSWNHV